MVATARRLEDPAPFLDAWFDLYAAGLCPIPLGDDQGSPNKRRAPLVGFRTLAIRPGPGVLDRWADRYSDANVGVLTGLSGVTVVDIDDPDQADAIAERFGPTPLVTSTPSGGMHRWYRSNGERNPNLRRHGLEADVKGIGGMVVVPPSIRPGGGCYGFLSGSWADVADLPCMNPGALDAVLMIEVSTTGAPVDNTIITDQPQVRGRNDDLFDHLLHQARQCYTFDQLVDAGRAANLTNQPPLTDTEVIKIATSVWKYKVEGKLTVGCAPHVRLDVADLDGFDDRPDALLLLAKLKAHHEGIRETFALVDKALVKSGFIKGWGRNRYREVIRWLVKEGHLVEVYKGGSCRGDCSAYRFPRRSKGSETGPNTNKHPAPAPVGSMTILQHGGIIS